LSAFVINLSSYVISCNGVNIYNYFNVLPNFIIKQMIPALISNI